MKRQLVTIPLLALFYGGAAHADDWLQFRRDASRSGVSKDSLKFPLKETWTWKTKARRGHTPLFHAVVRKGKIYFTASDNYTRYLICSDAKTGKVQWKQPLQTEELEFALSDIAGPAITEKGQLFVYDWMNPVKFYSNPETFQLLKKAYSRAVHEGASSCAAVLSVSNSFVVRAYDADSGKSQTELPLTVMGANGILPRLSLVEPFQNSEGQEVAAVPPTFAGAPP